MAIHRVGETLLIDEFTTPMVLSQGVCTCESVYVCAYGCTHMLPLHSMYNVHVYMYLSFFRGVVMSLAGLCLSGQAV